MKKIREFAVLCGTSSKTLRFYDKIGLLAAAYTDPENGYRYYSDEQKDQYEVIAMFKNMGFTLDEIKKEILGSDMEHMLETLRKKEVELKQAHDLCVKQIERYENALRKPAEDGVGRMTLQRYETEGKLAVSDGTITRVFSCSDEGMDICAEVLQRLFCTPDYVNLSPGDIPPFDEDRTVLVQMMDGTKAEVLSADFSALFDETDRLADIKTVLLNITFYGKTDIEDVDTAVSGIIPLFPEDCTVLWGSDMGNASEDRIRICLIGVC